VYPPYKINRPGRSRAVEYCALGWLEPVHVLEDMREWLIYVGPGLAYIMLAKVCSSWMYIDSNRHLSQIMRNLITALHHC
jgi:hypothetical protein